MASGLTSPETDEQASELSDPLADPCVHSLELEGRTIHLIGTAHVSEQSANLVRAVILATRPDAVCLELCESRLHTMQDPDAWRSMDIIKVIKEKKAFMLMLNFFLSSYQRRLAKQFGINPGQEMLAGLQTAKECGAEVVAIDREVRTTLARVWGSLTFWRKLKLYLQLYMSVFEDKEISESDIEALKEHDTLELMLDEFGQSLPEIKETLINERDRFMVEQLRESEGRTIVAVVGAGHVPGMKEHWGQTFDLAGLSALPVKSWTSKAIPWLIPVAVVGILVYRYLTSPAQAFDEIMYWVGANFIGAAIGGIVALGHPLSILAGAVSSPVSSLIPIVGAGMVAGLVEVYFRKPSVADFERLSDDICSTSGFWRNRVTRVLLVVILVSLGSAAGAWVGLAGMLRHMFS